MARPYLGGSSAGSVAIDAATTTDELKPQWNTSILGTSPYS